MRQSLAPGLASCGLLVAIAVLVTSCAAPPHAAREGAVVVARMERASWNAEPEPGLFRVTFDAQSAREIRLQIERISSQGAVDDYYAEIQALEQAAELEIRTRGMCSGSLKFLRSLDGSSGSGEMSAIFKCRPTLF